MSQMGKLSPLKLTRNTLENAATIVRRTLKRSNDSSPCDTPRGPHSPPKPGRSPLFHTVENRHETHFHGMETFADFANFA